MWVCERGDTPRVSVRAMILSVIRFDIDDSEPTRAVEKEWKTYQKANGLDIGVGFPDGEPVR
jgi:hypothetical protein